jgi:hypothetical protein
MIEGNKWSLTDPELASVRIASAYLSRWFAQRPAGLPVFQEHINCEVSPESQFLLPQLCELVVQGMDEALLWEFISDTTPCFLPAPVSRMLIAGMVREALWEGLLNIRAVVKALGEQYLLAYVTKSELRTLVSGMQGYQFRKPMLDKHRSALATISVLLGRVSSEHMWKKVCLPQIIETRIRQLSGSGQWLTIVNSSVNGPLSQHREPFFEVDIPNTPPSE